jgi:hypothetical protein
MAEDDLRGNVTLAIMNVKRDRGPWPVARVVDVDVDVDVVVDVVVDEAVALDESFRATHVQGDGKRM